MKRILLLCHPRSGSSYLIQLINNYYNQLDPTRQKSESEYFMDPSADPVTWESLLAHPNSVYKYFPWYDEIINIERIASIIEQHNIHTIALYRENILDYVVSRIVVDIVGKCDTVDELPTIIELPESLNNSGLYSSLRRYAEFQEMFRRFNSLGTIKQIIRYEDMSNNHLMDLKLIFPAPITTTTAYLEKIVDKDLHSRIIERYDLEQRLIDMMPNFKITHNNLKAILS